MEKLRFLLGADTPTSGALFAARRRREEGAVLRI